MFSRQVVIGRSRVLSAASGHFKLCQSKNGSHHRYQNAKYEYKSVPTVMFARLASTSSAVPSEITKVIEKAAADSHPDSMPSLDELISSIGALPDVPQPPTAAPVILEILSNGEPSLASLGLGGYWPPGIFQQLLELVHVHLDIPWVPSLLLLTAVVRLCLFPIVVRQIKVGMEVAKSMPAFMALNQKLSVARDNNDHITAAMCAMQLQQYAMNTKHGPLASLKFGIVQGIVLYSITIGLRRMCELPVESLQTGGILHVMDLTACDPTYILPVVCGLALHTHLRFSAEFTASPQSDLMRKLLLYGVPFVTTGFGFFMPNVCWLLKGVMIMDFWPAAVFYSVLPGIFSGWELGFIIIYWTANTGIAFVQSRLIKSSKLRAYYNIPKVVPAVPSQMQGTKKPFVDGFKEALNNMRVVREVEHRQLMDQVTFEQAGREPIRKTYKYNPKAAVSAKKVIQ